MAKLTNQSTTEAAAAAGLMTTPSPSMLHLEETVRKSKLYGNNNNDDDRNINSAENKGKSIDDVSKASPLAKTPLPIENVRASPRRLSSVVTTSPDKAMNGTCPVFLRIGDKTKKCHVQLPTTKNALRLLFIERFAYSPGANSFPDIYIMDPQYGVFYELEELNLLDIKEGFVIELKLEENQIIRSRNSLTQLRWRYRIVRMI